MSLENIPPVPNNVDALKDIPGIKKFEAFMIGLIFGSLMGDASIVEVNKNTKTARYRISQSKEQHEEYINKLFQEFKLRNYLTPDKNEPSVQIKPATQFVKKEIAMLYFYTSYLKLFYMFYYKFYSTINQKKVLPKTTRQDISNVAVAFWYMDDGSKKSKQGKGLTFATKNLSIYEVFTLCDILRRKFNVFASPRQQKKIDVARLKEQGIDPDSVFDVRERCYVIAVSGLFFDEISKIIEPYLTPKMFEKWPTPRKPKGKRTKWKVSVINQGRFIRIVKQVNKEFVVTEKLLDYDLKNVQWEYSTFIKQNNVLDYLVEYKKSQPINLNTYFKNWD